MKNCNFYFFEEATYAFVGKTFDDKYKHVFLCDQCQKELYSLSKKQGVIRQKGMAKEYFNNKK
jgi:hypothetical protein